MAELLLYSEIVSPSLRKMCDAGMDAELFAQQLGETSGDLTVRINSPGGDVDNGLAIYNQLQAERAKGRRVTCIVDGGAHSIASVIAMAGDEVHMAESSRMLVHQPRMATFGTAEEMRQAAQRLDAGSEAIRAAYKHKTGLSDDALNALLDAETFLTSGAAAKLKFVDKVIAPPARAPMVASADSFHHPLARAVALLAAQTPHPAAAKDNDMQTQTDKPVELVEKAQLEAAQTELASLRAQAEQAKAAAPVLAAVAKLTGKSDATDQILELAALQSRLASLPSAAQMQAQERASLVAELQRKQVPPTAIAALEAACDAAGGDLAVLRAGAQKLEAPRVYQPATQEKNAAAPVQTEAEIAIDDNDRAFYHARGITDEAQMLERKRAGIEAQTQKGRA